MAESRTEFIKRSLLLMGSNCVHGRKVGKKDAAYMMRQAYDEIRRLEAEVARSVGGPDPMAQCTCNTPTRFGKCPVHEAGR